MVDFLLNSPSFLLSTHIEVNILFVTANRICAVLARVISRNLLVRGHLDFGLRQHRPALWVVGIFSVVEHLKVLLMLVLAHSLVFVRYRGALSDLFELLLLLTGMRRPLRVQKVGVTVVFAHLLLLWSAQTHVLVESTHHLGVFLSLDHLNYLVICAHSWNWFWLRKSSSLWPIHNSRGILLKQLSCTANRWRNASWVVSLKHLLGLVNSTNAGTSSLIFNPRVKLYSFNLLFVINLQTLLELTHVFYAFWLHHALLNFTLQIFVLQVRDTELVVCLIFSTLVLIYLYLRSWNRVVDACANALICLSVCFVVVAIWFAFILILMHELNGTSCVRPAHVMETLGALLVHSLLLLLHDCLRVSVDVDVRVIVVNHYDLARLSKCVVSSHTSAVVVFVRFKIDWTVWILVMVGVLLTKYTTMNVVLRLSVDVINRELRLLHLLLINCRLLLHQVSHGVVGWLSPVEGVLIESILSLLVLMNLVILLRRLLLGAQHIVVHTQGLCMHRFSSIGHQLMVLGFLPWL